MNDLMGRLDAQRANAILLVRVTLAAVLIVAGYPKLFVAGIPAVIDGFSNMGLFAAPILGPVVTLLEFFGGIAILLGVGSRLLSIWVIVQFTIITIYVKPVLQGQDWSSMRLTLMVAVLGFIIATYGPGPMALGKRLTGRSWAQ